MFPKGTLRNDVLTNDNAAYPLDGMVSPTFQNEGETVVLLDGRKVSPGESYIINQPGIILTGSISVKFVADGAAANRLYVGYIRITDQ